MSEQFSDAIISFIRHRIFILILFGFLLLFVISMSFYFLSSESDQTHVAITRQISPIIASKSIVGPILVDVEGAVSKPGVYALPVGSRMQAAINAAHGFASTADMQKIRTELNLAAKLSDAMKIYIPGVGQSQSVIADESLISLSNLVNINTASLYEIDHLPHINSVIAQRIINNRPYRDIMQLQTEDIVTSSFFNQIKDKITTN